MAQFPKLKTGAVAQYPAVREQRYSTEVNRFLDNAEQRYRDYAAGRRRWVIALEKLDETETATLARFFEEQQGRFGTFDFEDPWTGMVTANCRFGEDQFPMQEASESRCSLRLTVEEVPG
ncbi:MAG: DUF2460 domain-containing protein [Acidobacteria bacterium]|nr:DUF2460 domain-containing protein [Acidobacteriota bacterium]